jgi:hypothetical protein
MPAKSRETVMKSVRGGLIEKDRISTGARGVGDITAQWEIVVVIVTLCGSRNRQKGMFYPVHGKPSFY